MNLLNRQLDLKGRLTNPIYEVKHKHYLHFIILYLKGNKLIRISHSTTLNIKSPPHCDHEMMFPFPNLDLASAFERRVRYFYKHHTEAGVPSNE